MSKGKGKKDKKEKSGSTQIELVKPDLTFPGLMDELRQLPEDQYNQFKERIQFIKKMTWQQVYDTSTKSKKEKRGLNWEVLDGQITADGKPVASIRISGSFRARVSRKDDLMRFISLHPNHDSAYK